MSESAGAETIDFEPLGATESAEPLHQNGFATIELDAAGAYALTRSSARQPLVWDLSTGARVPGSWLRVHADGRRGLRAEPDGTVSVSEIASGERLAVLEGVAPAGPPMLGPGRFAMSLVRTEATDEQRSVPFTQLWDLRTGRRAGQIEHPTLIGAALSGDRLLLADDKGQATLFDAASGKVLATLKGPKEKALWLRVSADEKTAVAISKKSTTVWDLETLKLSGTYDTVAKALAGSGRRHVELLADGRRAAIAVGAPALGDHFVSLLDLRTGVHDEGITSTAPRREVRAMQSLRRGPYVAMLVSREAAGTSRAEIWDVDHAVLVGAVDAPLARVMAVAAGDRLVVGGNSAAAGAHYLRVYNLVRRQAARLPEAPEGAPAPRQAPVLPELPAVVAPVPGEEAPPKTKGKGKAAKPAA